MQHRLIDFRNFYLQLGFSRQEVADVTHVGLSTVYRWESKQKCPLIVMKQAEVTQIRKAGEGDGRGGRARASAAAQAT